MAGNSQETIGVLLLNLGGPERLADVEPFLYNLFSDRQIIRLSPFSFLQKPIAKFIAKRRAPNSCKAYKHIGGGSPLRQLTAGQGQALGKLLSKVTGYKVDMAMRYWHPDTRTALSNFAEAGISKIVALSLYPQYSKATTGSSLDELHKVAGEMEADFTITVVENWPKQQEYINSLARMIHRAYGRLPVGEKATLVYSAHSLPVKFIQDGDPYLDDLAKTITAIEDQTGIPGKLCFQSRSGPVEWLGPSTPDTLIDLSVKNVTRVVMMPISFVSDHVETLYEIDLQYAELAKELGITLTRTDSLNLDQEFIKGLAKLVLGASRREGWV